MDGETASNNQSDTGESAKPCGFLRMETAGGRPREIPLRHLPVVIGRNARADIRIALPSVGRRHCEIAQNGLFLVVRAIGDHDFHINGKRTTRAALEEGDTLAIGPVCLRYSRQQQAVTRDAPLIDVARDPRSLDVPSLE